MRPEEENPRRNIISVRITDEELESLTRALRLRKTTISQLMRDALESAAFYCGTTAADGGRREATESKAAVVSLSRGTMFGD